MSHASQQYAFTEPRTVKRAQVKPSEREHQTSSSAPRVSLAPAADRTLDILEFIASNGQTQAATLARELGIPRSTVYQLLEILERHGLVTRLAEQRAYGIGLKTFELGSAYSCFASMFVRQVRQCFSAVWADGFPRCRHRFPVM